MCTFGFEFNFNSRSFFIPQNEIESFCRTMSYLGFCDDLGSYYDYSIEPPLQTVFREEAFLSDLSLNGFICKIVQLIELPPFSDPDLDMPFYTPRLYTRVLHEYRDGVYKFVQNVI